MGHIGVLNHNPNIVDEYDLKNERILPLVEKYTDNIEFATKICEIVDGITCLNLNAKSFYECAKNILYKSKFVDGSWEECREKILENNPHVK